MYAFNYLKPSCSETINYMLSSCGNTFWCCCWALLGSWSPHTYWRPILSNDLNETTLLCHLLPLLFSSHQVYAKLLFSDTCFWALSRRREYIIPSFSEKKKQQARSSPDALCYTSYSQISFGWDSFGMAACSMHFCFLFRYMFMFNLYNIDK